MAEEDENPEQDILFMATCALREAGLTENQIDDAINSMQSYGILFQQRPNNPTLF